MTASLNKGELFASFDVDAFEVPHGRDELWRVSKGDCRVVDHLRSRSFLRARFVAPRDERTERLASIVRRREHVGDRYVGQIVAVRVNVHSVDSIWMESVRLRIRVENDHGSGRIGGGLECVEVT